MHALAFMILVLGAIAVTAVIFVFWVVITIIRGITRMVLGPGLKPRATGPRVEGPYTRRCPRDSCKATNATEARYCRRCGHHFQDAQHVPVRRVALL
jgi:hypothetical protein